MRQWTCTRLGVRAGQGGAPVQGPSSQWALALAAALLTMLPSARAEEDPARYIEFTQDFTGNCVARQGVQILVRSTHPTRTVRVWLDRFHMGTGTGDRSRSELRPNGEAVALGCSRTTTGPQEWRVVRAAFVD